MEKNHIKGIVEHIVYRNGENGYTVLSLSVDGEELTAVGVLPEIGEGEQLEAEGSYTVHATYGEQFKISSFELLPPESVQYMERYLGSGIIKGIRGPLAHRIVKKFGGDTFRIIEQEPERLAEIKGISEKKAREIAEQVYEKRDQRDALLFLSRYGVSNTLAMRIYKAYGQEIYRIIRENPYKLADDMTGVGFRTADEIARRAGIAVDSHFRISSGILYILQLAGTEGSIYLPREVLLRRTAALLGMRLRPLSGISAPGQSAGPDAAAAVPALPAGPAAGAAAAVKAGEIPFSAESSSAAKEMVSGGEDSFAAEDWEEEDFYPDPAIFAGADAEWDLDDEDGEDPIESCLENLSVERKLVIRQEEGEVRVYAAAVYMTELRCAQMLHDLNIRTEGNPDRVRTRILAAQKAAGTELDAKQMEAVLEADRCGLLILTGGPGTGKTTTINTMISVFENEGLSITLAAPTGRAAKRMTEATGREAKTIHRLLEVSGDPDAALNFGRDEDKPLEEDVIIVDEMSMVDLYLLHALLKAVPVGAHLVMAGDANQLPSVGPGAVLKDMIESGTIPVVTLKTIFRQAQESDIVVNAHRINDGICPELSNKSRDFFFMKEYDPNRIIGLAIKLVRDNLPRYVKASSADIQVMTPMKKGNLGVLRLNKVMQQYLNPEGGGKREHLRGETIFRERDRVMQIKNNYQIAWETRGRFGAVLGTGEGVFNGDMGVISEINEFTNTLTVEFDEHRFVEYEMNDLDQLELAYAVTIHKAQGSEYPAVVIPLLRGPRMLMNRNLLYTAVTRARSCVVLIGDPSVMKEMIDNTSEARRYTTLALRLKECRDAAEGGEFCLK